MSRTLIILSVFLVGAVMVQARPEVGTDFELQPQCINNYRNCRFSIVPCCGIEELPTLGMTIGEEFTCSVFDSGRCEPIKSFKNIQKHFELVGKLNDSDFEELRRQYFRDLQRLERERAAVSVPEAVSNRTEECIPPLHTCRGISKPCCGREALPDSGILMGQEYTCHVFGSGRCKALQVIRNLKLHNELVEQLNETNFHELRNQYLMNRQVGQKQTEGKPTADSEVGLVAKEKLEPSCISHHGHCRFSSRPCCGKEGLMFGVMMGEDYTSSVFDTGRCEPIRSFKNIEKHLELASQLNENNFEELRIKYFKDLQRLEREQAAVKPTDRPVVGFNAETEFMPKCIKHYHRCRGVSKPCCGQEALPTSGVLVGQEYTCAVFGSGLCEPTSSFKNIQKHLELVGKLNDTNFEALKIEYETDLQKALTERAKGKLDVVIVDKDGPELKTRCISNHDRCRFSGKPCCGKEALPILGMMIGEDYTCSVFDSGRCEPIRSFANLHKHFQLVSRLTETNFEPLRIEYFKELQKVERERTTAKPTAEPGVGLEAQPEPEPTCIKHYDDCRGISKPCCGKEANPTLGILMPQEYLCSVFDSGRCEPITSFRNIQMHLTLVDKLNNTNFEELKLEYVTSLPKVGTERAASKRTTGRDLTFNEVFKDINKPGYYGYKSSLDNTTVNVESL
uniref:LHv2.8 cys-motif protein n=1 Tax=Campoletis sonorensis ichnovirus TaxID=10484 RepID=Q80KH7_CSIV|nr:LHv2.8 cys-motif protein precursor [Ichnoviriform sonorense]